MFFSSQPMHFPEFLLKASQPMQLPQIAIEGFLSFLAIQDSDHSRFIGVLNCQKNMIHESATATRIMEIT